MEVFGTVGMNQNNNNQSVTTVKEQTTSSYQVHNITVRITLVTV